MRTDAARTRLAQVLSTVGDSAAFCARRTAPPADLHIEIDGVGALELPVSAVQARQLRAVARPARYGQGEQTLVDARVRDTWEIPKSRVRIDRRRFGRTLTPVLDAFRSDLGIAEGSRLAAELHSVLLYEPGQFFLPHQDSEKSDDMVGTLVVALPSVSKGGELVIEHAGNSKTHRASGKLLTFVAFYADCRHEVVPLTGGHRIVLTYNLRLVGKPSAIAADPLASAAIAMHLTEHFEAENRLVYLLDHEYTQRGLTWTRLKGADAARVAALRAAAQSIDCELALAAADIHETWDCIPSYGRYRRGWYGDDDDPDDYELGDLIDGSIVLDGAVGPAQVSDNEVCAATPTDKLTPVDSQYEGYMGNYGNTMDRWYRRGAVVVWPRRLDFAVRAEGAPVWALEELARRVEDGTAQEAATTLAPFWHDVVRRISPGPERPELGLALEVARDLGDPGLAAMLLAPFNMEELAGDHARTLDSLAVAYGIAWLRTLVEGWDDSRAWHHREQRPAWVAGLPEVCGALGQPAVAHVLLEPSWRWLAGELRTGLALTGPLRRSQALDRLVAPLAGLLAGAVTAASAPVFDAAVAALSGKDKLVSTAVAVLRRIGELEHSLEPYAALADHAARRLEARLADAVRDPDDWSIPPIGACRWPECRTFGEFLGDPGRRTLEWKLAEAGRNHIRDEIARHELPVRHETRKTGRPYTLVLTKTSALFEREARTRTNDESDLAWLRDNKPQIDRGTDGSQP